MCESRSPGGLAALVAILDYPDVAVDEFNEWYDAEHIRERLASPGFVSAQRWLVDSEQPTSLVFYDLENLGALKTGEHSAISGEALSPWSKRIIAKCQQFRRYEALQLVPGDAPSPEGANALFFIAMNVDADAEQDFNRWYDEEHLPRLAAVPGVTSARRYRAQEGPQRYFAVYHVERAEVVGSPEWLEAAETPWMHRIRPRTSDRIKFICRPYAGP